MRLTWADRMFLAGCVLLAALAAVTFAMEVAILFATYPHVPELR